MNISLHINPLNYKSHAFFIFLTKLIIKKLVLKIVLTEWKTFRLFVKSVICVIHINFMTDKQLNMTKIQMSVIIVHKWNVDELICAYLKKEQGA